jgi:multiple sugar transport system ATP-binding protein
LDEPLSNLDALLREGMRSELKSLFRRVEATVIYVTHDQAEAMSLSDQLAVMRDGKILQCGSPLEVYAHPEDLFVATFVGSPRMTVWRGRRAGPDFAFASGLRLPAPPGIPADRDIDVGVRPEDVQVFEAPEPGTWPSELVLTEPMGPHSLLTLKAGESEARALAAPRKWPARLWMRWLPERLHWFDAASGRRMKDASSGEGGSG